MAGADVVITGTVLTVDDARPTAEALAVTDGRIIAVGTRSDVAGFVGADTQTIDVGDGLHNDPPVTPEEPLRNISVAVTRTAPSGRVLAPEERLTVDRAIRAQTIDAAWQLFADDVVGSLEVGKYADMVVLSADPRTVPPEQIAELDVHATFLAGRQVYRQ
jgi:predicted amidohydrolase YtcJ